MLYKILIGLVLSIALAGGPALYVHLQDNKALKAQADRYNAVYAKAQADSAAQLQQLQTKAAAAVSANTVRQAEIHTQTVKTVTVIQHAQPEKCLDSSPPPDILEQLRQPPSD